MKKRERGLGERGRGGGGCVNKMKEVRGAGQKNNMRIAVVIYALEIDMQTR